MSHLARVADAVRAPGGLLAAAVTDPPGASTPLGDAAAARGAEYAVVVEAIHEGYLQHYGRGRIVRTDDPDLALLAGDRLYALGLERLAALGDLDAVAELADVISLAAQAHAEDDPERARAIWQAGVTAVARGSSTEHEAAKAAWRDCR